MAKDPNKLQQAIDQTRGRVSDAADAITGSDAVSTLKTTLSSGADKLTDVTGKVRDRLPDVAPLADRVQSPIGLIIGFAAAGVIAGLALPLTDYERERLEPIGGDLAQRAIDARDELLEQGRQVVSETVSAAKESVQKHGQDLASNLGVSGGDSGDSGDGATQSSSPEKKPDAESKPSGLVTPSQSSTTPSQPSSKPSQSSTTPSQPNTQSAASQSKSQSDTLVTPSEASAQSAQRLSDGTKTRDALQKSGIIKPPGSTAT